jgi:hypothetical protein
MLESLGYEQSHMKESKEKILEWLRNDKNFDFDGPN